MGTPFPPTQIHRIDEERMPVSFHAVRSTPALMAIALALAAAPLLAQTPAVKPAPKAAGKTLGGNAAPSGKLMTREELRSCLKRLEDLNVAAKDVEAQRPVLDRERDELKAAGDTLKAERAEVDNRLAAVREWEVRMRNHASEIEAYNKRNAALQEAPRGQQESLMAQLNADRERLQKAREALGGEEAGLVPAYQSQAKAYNERALARDAKVNEWNARNATAVEASVKQQESRVLWLNECANRPYLEDDEKAIKAGK